MTSILRSAIAPPARPYTCTLQSTLDQTQAARLRWKPRIVKRDGRWQVVNTPPTWYTGPAGVAQVYQWRDANTWCAFANEANQ